MTSVQKWLDENYPPEEGCQNRNDYDNKNKKRNEIKKLKVKTTTELEGWLDLSGFTILEELDCSDNKLTGLNLTSCSQLKIIKVSQNQLTSLDLSQNINLEELECDNNQLTNLDLQKNTKLTKLDCFWNKLTSLELNNLQLQSLDIGENQITASFAIFSHLKKLRDLRLDGNSNNGGNNFFGSLAFLKGCESLEVLSIHNQKNITGKLEDLPVAKLEKVFCRDTIFWEELEFFSSNFRDWRELKWLGEEREREIEIATATPDKADEPNHETKIDNEKKENPTTHHYRVFFVILLVMMGVVGIVLLTKKKFCQKIKKEIISKLKCCFSLWR